MEKILLLYFHIFILFLHHWCLSASPTNIVKLNSDNKNDLNKAAKLGNIILDDDMKNDEKWSRNTRSVSNTNIGHVIKKRAARIRIFRRPEVAFQATLTKPSETVQMLHNINFNKVITNIGHAYNHHTGVFTAPLYGTYNFNTNIVAERGHYIEASIVRNGEVAVSAISDHRTSQDGKHFMTWDQGNAVAILRLRRGDKVAVTLQWPQGSHTIHGVRKSSFSGYLL